jgi:hypothetical protein
MREKNTVMLAGPGIDPIRLAQFMVLPGAAELVEAFAALPPGELRDSAVAHVQVLARHAGVMHAGEFNGAMAHHAPPQLTSQSLEGQIVERALRGDAPEIVAGLMQVPLKVVERVMAKARKEGGVVFPGDGGRKAKVKPPEQDNRVSKREQMPVPPPPWWWQDPDSPVWDNPAMLPGFTDSADGSMAAIGPHDRRTYAAMKGAAERHGMSLQAYIARRQSIVDRITGGETPLAVMADLKLNAFSVYKLLRSVGRGRAEQVMAGAGPQEPVGKRIAGGRRVDWARWGFKDEASCVAAREQVKALRLEGLGPTAIVAQTKWPFEFVRASIESYHKRGQQWPKIKAA